MTWLKIKHFPNYSASNTGLIRNDITNKILKQSTNHFGYKVVNIRNENNIWKIMRVNRLIAIAFLDNPNNYPIINHKNENKSDNRVENLEWCTYQYNNSYGTINKRNSESHKVKVVLDFKLEFDSVRDCAKFLGCKPTAISNVLNGWTKRIFGHNVSYKED